MQYGIVFSWDVSGSQVIKATTEPIYQHSIGIHSLTLNAEAPTGNLITVTYLNANREPITEALAMQTSDYKVWTSPIPDIVLAESGTKYVSFANKSPLDTTPITYKVQTSGICAVTIDATGSEQAVTPIEESVVENLQNQINELNALTADMLHSDGSVPMDNGYTPENDQDIATKKYVDDNGSTIEVGTVSQGAEGSMPVITNSGTDRNAVFNFVIPKGDTGNGIASITKTQTVGLYDTYTITYTNGNTTTFVVKNGEKGDTGEGFHISATFESVEEMEAAIDDYEVGDFVLIETGDVEDPDNAKLYVKAIISGEAQWSYLTDMSGSQGLTGVGIQSISKTSTSGLVDTYTITMTDTPATTYTFTVTNAKSVVSIELTDTDVLTDTYTITYNDGTTQDYEITNGRGITSVAKTSTSVLTDTYTITYNDNTTSTYTINNGRSITGVTKTGTSENVDTYTIAYNDNTTSTFTVTNGVDGNGISRIVKTSSSGVVDTYTIYFTNGTTSTFEVTNGIDGTDGTNGVGIVSVTKTGTQGLVDTYTITFTNDTTTTFQVTNGADGEGSGMTSVYVDSEVVTRVNFDSDPQDQIDDAFESISGITEKIPSEATRLNQLADKAFVNSSISTQTANFKGTYDVESDLGLVYGASHSDIATALLSAISGATINDYCFAINQDTNGNIVYERYKYSGSAWQFEYDLNNSSFTASQWATITSGLTSADVTQIETNKTNISTNTSNISSLTTQVSQNTSAISGLNTTVGQHTNSINSLSSGKQDVLSTAQLNAANSGITSGKVSTYDGYATTIAGKQSQLSDTQLGAVNSGITSTKVSTYDGYATGKQNTLNANQLNAVNSGITSTRVSAYDNYSTTKANKPNSISLTLTSGGWSNKSQTVSNSGIVVSGYDYIITPSSASHSAYGESGIKASDITTDGQITFTCEDVPTSNLTVYVLKVQIA